MRFRGPATAALFVLAGASGGVALFEAACSSFGAATDPGADDARADAPSGDAPVVPGGAREWMRVATAGPSPRHSAAMTFDSARHRVVLFGGRYQSAPPFDDPNDTWTWDGTSWVEAKLTGPLMVRHGARLVFDADRSVVVLAGGVEPFGEAPTNIWEWDGSSVWVQKMSTGPQAQATHSSSFAYNSARKRSTLFGGNFGFPDGSASGTDETWEWGGASLGWTQLQPTTHPPGWSGAAMAYDSRRDKMVMFGGVSGGTTPTAETWEFDGNEWQHRTPQSLVPARTGACMTFDPSRGVTVLHGGRGGTGGYVLLNDTWLWDGTDWTPLPSASAPPPRKACSMAFDAAHDAIVMFGGTTRHDRNTEAGTREMSGETWLLK